MKILYTSACAHRPWAAIFFKVFAVIISIPIGCFGLYGFGFLCYRFFMKDHSLAGWIIGFIVLIMVLYVIFLLSVFCFYVVMKGAFQKPIRSYEITDEGFAIYKGDDSVDMIPFHNIGFIELGTENVRRETGLLHNLWEQYCTPWKLSGSAESIGKYGLGSKEGMIKVIKKISPSELLFLVYPWRLSNPENYRSILLTPGSPKEFYKEAAAAFSMWNTNEHMEHRKIRVERNQNISYILRPEKISTLWYTTIIPHLLISFFIAFFPTTVLMQSPKWIANPSPFKWLWLMYYIPLVFIVPAEIFIVAKFIRASKNTIYEFLDDRLRYTMPLPNITTCEILYDDISSIRLINGFPKKCLKLSVIEISTLNAFTLNKNKRPTHVLKLVHIRDGQEVCQKINEIVFGNPEYKSIES